ncbi:hypothetical protein CRUP_011355 [Coryphaenoides rupestris]|nr:hypothetical protein CRUP_011355 [Coryphaenoides rupestris]
MISQRRPPCGCREKLVAANMAMMPKMVADWKRQRRETKQKQVEEKARRAALLAETHDRLGYEIDPRSARFREMFTEVEKEHRQKAKMLKKQKKEQQQQRVATTPAPPQDG